MSSAEPHQPRVVIIAGPNGAGKTTSSRRVLSGLLDVDEFVNADIIAQGLAGIHPERVAVAAGRIMLDRLNELAAQKADFAFETTLASRTFAPWVGQLRPNGYRAYLLCFWLPDPEMSVSRVAARVRRGGHHVPAETVRRRYGRSLRNFFSLYRPVVDGWEFFDNSESAGPRTIAWGDQFGAIVSDPAIWGQLQARWGHGPAGAEE
jgi:predicted ABC-type ATPase